VLTGGCKNKDILLGTQLVAKCLLSGGPNRPSGLLRADVRAQEGMVRPHGLAIRVVRALIGWAMSVRRRQKVGCRLLLNTNFQENIQKSWGRREAKIYNFVVRGLKRNNMFGSHTFFFIHKFSSLIVMSHVQTHQGAMSGRRLLGGGEGFIELGVCDAHSGRSVGLPFVWLLYGFICELVKILHLGRNSSLPARCILMKKGKIFACVCLLAAEGMSYVGRKIMYAACCK
jgi:hypothetical protein